MIARLSIADRIVRRRVAGVEALFLPSPGSGLVALQIYLRRGSVDEAEGECGLASFTASMLRRGTAKRNSLQIAFELESLGAFTSHGAGTDACSSAIRSATADLPAALEVFFDSLRNPAFDAKELEIERQSVLSHLKRIEDEKFEFTYREYVKRIFASHGYGHMPEGEIEDVRAITRERCRAWHQKAYRPEHMMIVAAGDFDPDDLCATLEPHFAGWPAVGKACARCETRSEGHGGGLTEIRKPLEQGFIVAGFRAPEFRHTDHAALRLASAALGEGFAGRLFTHLRDERSLAYAVGSALRAQRLGGHMMLYIGTQPERLDEAREGLLAETEWLRHNLISDDDLRRSCNYVCGKYVMDHQSLGSRAGYLARWEDLGFGADYDDQYPRDLRSVTAAQILEAARRWWVDPTIVVLRPEN